MLKLKSLFFIIAAFFLILWGTENGFSQSYSVEITVTNQPQNHILFGTVEGDSFSPIDSSFIYPESGKVVFKFPEDALPGTYRVVFGKTSYAKIMDEPAQQLDFIFNNENIALKTDYKEPFQKLEILQSEENKVWFTFLSKDAILQQDIESLKRMLDHYWSIDDTERATKTANEYNMVQMERDHFVVQAAQQNTGLLASVYIRNQRQPLLDGYLNPSERLDLFHKEFFKPLDFTDERLIHSSIYSDNVFVYLASYNSPDFTKEQREKAYIKAVDIVIQNIGDNQAIKKFILEYLVQGFEVLQLDAVIEHVSKKYNYKP